MAVTTLTIDFFTRDSFTRPPLSAGSVKFVLSSGFFVAERCCRPKPLKMQAIPADMSSSGQVGERADQSLYMLNSRRYFARDTLPTCRHPRQLHRSIVLGLSS